MFNKIRTEYRCEAYCTIIAVRGNANFRPTSSTTLIWQIYRPGATAWSGTCNCTGTALGRVVARSVADTGPALKVFTPLVLKRLMLTLILRALKLSGSGAAS